MAYDPFYGKDMGWFFDPPPKPPPTMPKPTYVDGKWVKPSQSVIDNYNLQASLYNGMSIRDATAHQMQVRKQRAERQQYEALIQQKRQEFEATKELKRQQYEASQNLMRIMQNPNSTPAERIAAQFAVAGTGGGSSGGGLTLNQVLMEQDRAMRRKKQEEQAAFSTVTETFDPVAEQDEIPGTPARRGFFGGTIPAVPGTPAVAPRGRLSITKRVPVVQPPAVQVPMERPPVAPTGPKTFQDWMNANEMRSGNALRVQPAAAPQKIQEFRTEAEALKSGVKGVVIINGRRARID
jgi:hypothetical protein